jgi:hypothetical protein
VSVKLLKVPARQGLAWVQGGLRTLWREPMAGGLLFMSFLFGTMVLFMVPLVGPLVALTLMPTITTGFVLATRRIVTGERPTPAVLVEALRGPHRRGLLTMGLAFALAGLGVQALCDLIDPGFDTLMDAFMGGREGSATQPALTDAQEGALQRGLLLRMLLPMPVTLLFWHAPVILHLTGGTVARAVFASGMACLRNLGAFTVFGLGWVLGLGLVVSVLTLLAGVLGLQSVLGFTVVPLALLTSTAFYLSLYFTVNDCLSVDRGGPVAGPAADGPATTPPTETTTQPAPDVDEAPPAAAPADAAPTPSVTSGDNPGRER